MFFSLYLSQFFSNVIKCAGNENNLPMITVFPSSSVQVEGEALDTEKIKIFKVERTDVEELEESAEESTQEESKQESTFEPTVTVKEELTPELSRVSDIIAAQKQIPLKEDGNIDYNKLYEYRRHDRAWFHCGMSQIERLVNFNLRILEPYRIQLLRYLAFAKYVEQHEEICFIKTSGFIHDVSYNLDYMGSEAIMRLNPVYLEEHFRRCELAFKKLQEHHGVYVE